MAEAGDRLAEDAHAGDMEIVVAGVDPGLDRSGTDPYQLRCGSTTAIGALIAVRLGAMSISLEPR